MRADLVCDVENPVANLYVKRPAGDTGYFIAGSCEIADGFVTVTGQFKRMSGIHEPVRSYTWPRSRIVEIRWTRALEAVA